MSCSWNIYLVSRVAFNLIAVFRDVAALLTPEIGAHTVIKPTMLDDVHERPHVCIMAERTADNVHIRRVGVPHFHEIQLPVNADFLTTAGYVRF
jgi:hypothetical protein